MTPHHSLKRCARQLPLRKLRLSFLIQNENEKRNEGRTTIQGDKEGSPTKTQPTRVVQKACSTFNAEVQFTETTETLAAAAWSNNPVPRGRSPVGGGARTCPAREHNFKD